ncbi:hypothetical protein EN832_33470, partial [Mesorhizobium sp. M1C.F.Ca.ET.189.01.1.1]
VDFDGFFEDSDVEGHVGDVRVWRPCEGRAGYYEEIPGGYLPPFYPPEFPPPGNLPPCLDVDDVHYFCTPRGLAADLYLRDTAGFGGDSIKALSKTPGVEVVSPPLSHAPGKPYRIGIIGHNAGDTV